MEEIKVETSEDIKIINSENPNSSSSIKDESGNKFEHTYQTSDQAQVTQPTHYTENEQDKALDAINTMDQNILSEPSDKCSPVISQSSFNNFFNSTLEERLSNLEKKISKDILETIENLKYEFFEENLKCNFLILIFSNIYDRRDKRRKSFGCFIIEYDPTLLYSQFRQHQ